MTRSRSLGLQSIGIFVVAFTLYFFTLSHLYSFDALTNAIACERNEVIRWFHPNHPLYPFLGVLYYKLERGFGYEGLAIYSLARLNSLFMAAGLALLFYALSKKIGSVTSLVTVYFLGSCYSVWMYAVDGRAIGASAFFAILVILNLFSIDTSEGRSAAWLTKAVLFSVLYVLVHGIALFHVFAIAIALGILQDWRHSVAYLIRTMGGLAAICLVLFEVVAKTYGNPTFLSWMMGYASGDKGYWTSQIGPVIQGLWTGWQHAFLFDSRGGLISVVAVGIAASFLVLLGAGLIRKRTDIVREVPVVLPLVLWGVFVTMFMAVWSVRQEGFRLHALIPWTVALSLLYARSKPFLYAQAIGATVLFLINLTGPVALAANPANNSGYTALTEIRRHLQPNDVFVCARQNGVADIGALMPYFFPELSGGSLEGRLFAFREANLDTFQRSLADHLAHKHQVYVLDDFIDPDVQRLIETRYSLTPKAIHTMLSNFSLVDAFHLPNERHVYRLALRRKN